MSNTNTTGQRVHFVGPLEGLATAHEPAEPVVYEEAMGRQLVSSAVELAEINTSAENPPPNDPYKSPEYYESLIESDLQNLRSAIKEIPKEKQKTFDEYCDNLAPEFLKKTMKKQFPRKSWTKWLSKNASDEQLTNFFQVHIAKVEADQNNETALTEIEREKKEYKAGIQRGVNDGWLSADALDVIDKVDEVKVLMGDIFDTILQHRGGYHRRGTKKVIIAGSNGKKGAKGNEQLIINIRHATKHELNHAVLGQFNSRWLDEAVTEHISQSMDHGFPGRVDPDTRPNNDNTYYYERVLLGILLEDGDKTIQASHATKAYSSRTDSRHDYFFDFVGQLDDAWGRHVQGEMRFGRVINLISDYVERQERRFLEKGYSQKQAQDHALIKAASTLSHQPHIIFAAPSRK